MQSVALYNWNLDQYSDFRSSGLSPRWGEVLVEVPSSTSAYVRNGTLRVRLRSAAPYPFWTQVDAVAASARTTG
jgi:hypothetical protein